MNLNRTLALLTLLAFSQIARSQPAAPPGALGQVEATVGFCGRVDSTNADKYEELRKQIVAGMSDKELADARNSSEYRDSFRAATDELERLRTAKAVEACRGALQEEKK